jgi:hypothetical protein
MPIEYKKDGDMGFTGLNSRDNPSHLQQGTVTQSQNFRLDRGVATVRKGIKRLTLGDIIGKTVYGCGSYLDNAGQEIIVLITGSTVATVFSNQLWTYNPQTSGITGPISFAGETITTSDGCEICYAMEKVFITRGHNKRPLIWDLANSITPFGTYDPLIVAPATQPDGYQFPNCNGLLYYSNRLIATGQHYLSEGRSNYAVCVANYLEHLSWDAVDEFLFNQGGNDEVISITPWTLNEFLVFLRNSIFYVNIGLGRYSTGDGLSTTSFIKSLVTDTGCLAKRTVVQANGGILFLSDNGVYFLQPQNNSSNDSVRLLTVAEPLSAQINDVIQTINKTTAYKSVAIYFNNRYYLAVPIGTSETNNCVLVYNFILKGWESVDTYPAGFDVFNFIVCKRNNEKRVFIVDTNQGIFLMDELNYDEYQDWAIGDPNQGTPILPFPCGNGLSALLDESSFPKNKITGVLQTRRYNFESLGQKRFSTVEVEMVSEGSSSVLTEAIVTNPDSVTTIEGYGYTTTEDSMRRNPIRKNGSGIQLKFTSDNDRPTIRSSFVYATVWTQNNISKK